MCERERDGEGDREKERERLKQHVSLFNLESVVGEAGKWVFPPISVH